MVLVQHMGLGAKQHAAFERTLARSHEMRVRVNVLNMDGKFRSGLTPRLVDGQVDVRRGQYTTRIASIQLLDPDRTLHFDPDAPSEHALYRNRRIRIFYDVLVEELGIGWVETPLINGPCTTFNRSGAMVDVQISGMDYDWSTRNTWVTIKLHKGEQITDCIKRILRVGCGVTRMAIPDLQGAKYRMARDRELGKMSHPFLVAKQLANSIDRQLFVDGAAIPRLRRLPHGKPQFIFRDGNHQHIITDPQRSFTDDPDRFANGIWAKGRVLPGAKKPLEVRVWAPMEHELSPHQLGNGGVPSRHVEASYNPGFRTTDAMKEWALRRLHEKLEGAVRTDWESFVVPHLDIGDRVGIYTDEFHHRRNLWEFSIPLLPGGIMACGFNTRVSFGPSRGGRIWTYRPPNEPRPGLQGVA